MATDYKALAIKARDNKSKPLGNITEDAATVLLQALEEQDVATLRLVKADFPTEWNKCYQKGKNGHHYFKKEYYDALKTLANGDLTSTEEL